MLRKIIPRSKNGNQKNNRPPARTSPRRSLQRAVLERRASLTERECNFLLTEVCEQGSEQQARLAHRHVLELLPVDGATVRSASSTSDSDSQKQGSTRRQELLEERKKTSNKLWEAHDSGLAVTASASQRSLRRLLQSSPKKGSTMVARVRSLTKPRSTMPRPLKLGPRSRTVYSDSSDDESSRGLSIVEQHQRRLSSSMWSAGGGSGSRRMLLQQLTKDDFLTESENESLPEPLAAEVSSSSLLTHDDDMPKPSQAVMTREASMNTYMGEGFEIGLFQNDSGEARDGGETQRDAAVLADDDEREALQQDDDDVDAVHPIMQSPKKLQRPVLLKETSMSIQAPGEGMEVADWNHEWRVHHHQNIGQQQVIPFRRSNSFDQSMSYDRVNDRFTNTLKRSLSDGALRDHEEADEYFLAKIEEYDHYDPWDLLDNHTNDEGGMRITLPFQILGTHAQDVECHPHVLSPPLMERLQEYLPFSKRGENMLLKYSLVRDGASIHSFLKHARGASHAFLAVETVDGEVFGSFTAETWHKSQETYGNGQSFLWRMQHSRHEKAWSVIDQAQHESEIDVFPFISGSSRVQLCNDKYMVVGGLGDAAASSPSAPAVTTLLDGTVISKNEWGFGLCFPGDVLLEGTTAPCVSFLSPSLSHVHSDGSTFEIVNLELWTVTPCMTAERAEQLELKHLFLEDNLRRI